MHARGQTCIWVVLVKQRELCYDVLCAENRSI